jgi:hypothetical protein
MTSPSSPSPHPAPPGLQRGRAADEFAVAIAAHDIAVLVRDAPERLLWRPGCPLWALALDPGGGPDYLALDGALAIAALVWPGHVRGNDRYDLAAVARCLADDVPLADPPSTPLLSLSMPHSRLGAAVVRLARSALPFLARAPPVPAAGAPSWRCPAAPAEAAIAAPAHAWCAWTLLTPPAGSAEAFVDELDLPIDLVLLPPPWRAREALARARARLRLERCRLGVAGIGEPAWMADPQALNSAVASRLAVVGDAGDSSAAAAAVAPAPLQARDLVSTFTQNQPGQGGGEREGPCSATA